MHVLITGVTGFIGSNLCEDLIKKGLKVTGISHVTDDREFLLSHKALNDKNFQIIKCNIAEKKDFIEKIQEIQPIDCVFHLAGQTYSRKLGEPETYFQTNLIGTINVLECCRLFNIRKIIFSSSMAVYGLSVGQFLPQYVPVDEMHEARPYEFYDMSKYCAEQICKFYSDRFGISCIILRYSRVFGPNMKGGIVSTAITKALSGSTIDVTGDISTDFVFIGDVVKASVAAFEKPLEGFQIFNIGSGQEITLYGLCSKIASFTNSSSEINLLNGKKSRFSLDISKAKKLLSYNPTQIDESLIECINKFKKSRNDI